MSNPGQQAGPGLPGDLQTPLGITPTTGQITVDQQRNQMLANIAKSLSIFAIGGTVSGNLAVTGTFTPNSTKGIVGTTTNDNAQAGSVGEYISSTVSSGSALSLTTDTGKTITNINLTAGDWDVFGEASFIFAAGTTVNYAISSVSLTNNTAEQTGTNATLQVLAGAVGSTYAIPALPLFAGVRRVSIASTTTVYIVAQAGFAVSTCTAYGMIWARRVR